ncbi:VIN3-like protein 1 [Raphanus sativus]|uniref:VIN3-like protein 1 n=1 Tax=Raphanus sativus TaxID=3726 RepID=A0A6J0NSD8_RAPSA|nr:VIN3-like protein 1 [Raphanus sativus]
MDTKREISQSRKNQQQEADYDISNSWICNNASCRVIVPLDDSYCKRCSCCMCHAFDKNKDPTLWLICESGKPNDVEFCGLSCHVECALRKDMVWVNASGNLMKVDGYFCCYSCGKVSDILGCWKKQLVAAKDARRIDVLSYRIELSYRLLNGTSRFSELHEIVKDAKFKLEAEVGPLDGPSARTNRGIVSRLPFAMQVQELSSFAIRRAEYWSTNVARGFNFETSLLYVV